jgi:glucokinase
MTLASSSETLLGIDLGGTKIAVAAVQDGVIQHKIVVPTPKEGWQCVVDAMLEAGREIMKLEANIAGIGVCTPGPIDFKTGVVKFAPNIPGFENAPIKSSLEAGFARHVEIENDANAAGLAEHVYGAARGASSSVFVTVSTGIGGGIVFNNRVWRGANGIAGEIGHVVALPGGPLAGSGVHGALEAVASGTAISRDANFAHGYGRNISTREVFELAQQGEEKCLKIVNQAAHYVGVAIADMQKVYDPEIFVLGGGVSEVGDFYLDKVRAAAKVNARGFAVPVIRKAVMGSDAGVIGAALSARHH